MSKIIVLILLLATSNGYAEIFKLAVTGEAGIQFYWWPVLPNVEGWHHDRGSSIRYGINAQAPDGSAFSNAETVIYAKAIFKPRAPKLKSLSDFIKYDHNQFKARGIQILDEKPIYTADKKKLISYSFIPSRSGNWERVSYGEEGDFYLVFTISSRSEDGYTRHMKDYESFIARYKENP